MPSREVQPTVARAGAELGLGAGSWEAEGGYYLGGGEAAVRKGLILETGARLT